jgi:hypothetical protein
MVLEKGASLVKQRYLLCLLLGASMVYYAVPKLSFQFNQIEGKFTLVWLGFAILVLAGNVSAILYSPATRKAVIRERSPKKRVRSY